MRAWPCPSSGSAAPRPASSPAVGGTFASTAEVPDDHPLRAHDRQALPAAGQGRRLHLSCRQHQPGRGGARRRRADCGDERDERLSCRIVRPDPGAQRPCRSAGLWRQAGSVAAVAGKTAGAARCRIGDAADRTAVDGQFRWPGRRCAGARHEPRRHRRHAGHRQQYRARRPEEFAARYQHGGDRRTARRSARCRGGRSDLADQPAG